MGRRFVKVAGLAAAIGLSAFAAGGQAQEQAGAAGGSVAGAMKQYQIKSELLGQSLRNDQNVVLGTIDDMVVSQSGTVQYLLISPTRDQRAARQQVAVPWLAITTRDGNLILPMAKEKFAQSPAWDQQRRAGAAANWDTVVYEHYGLTYIPEKTNFSQFDTNSDNALSRSEALGNPWLAAHFKKLDADKNGSLSQSEFSAFTEAVVQPAATMPSGGGMTR